MGNQWSKWGSPLRPSPEDVTLFRKRTQQRVLLVGYTAELIGMASHVVDIRPPEVINSPELDVFLDTGGIFINRDWFMLGNHDIGKFDVIMGDGALNVCGQVGSGEDMTSLFEILRKKLTDEREARMVFRVYINQRAKEPLNKILLTKGDDFNVFKWRLAMAMADPFIRLGHLYDALQKHWPDGPIEVYASNPNGQYIFPTFEQLPHQQRIMEADIPTSYPLAERCPVVTWTF